MSNQFLNAQEYSNVMLLLLKNQLVFGKLVDGQYKNEVTDENGLTINVKRPPRFLDKKDGTAALASQDIVTGTQPVKVDQYSKVHISVGDIEYVASYNELMRNATMRSAASTLAHSIDGFIAKQTLNFHSWVSGQEPGAAGDVEPNATATAITVDHDVASPSQAMSGHTRLMDQGVPNESLSGVVTFSDGQRIRGSLLGSFEPPDINRPALERVRIPVISEIDWYGTQQLPTLTTGTRLQGNGTSTGDQVGAANQNVNYRDVKGVAGTGGMIQTLNIVAVTGETFKKGEVFTIAGVFQWDWRAQQAIPRLQQFTVQADVTAAASAAALVISPPIIVQGTNDGVSTDVNTAFATVDSIPAANAFIQWTGAPSTKFKIRPVFHKRAISLVSAKLIMPFTGVASFAVDPDTGIAVRYWRGSDISTGAHIHRWDCMYGAAVLDPFLGTRLMGS